MIASLRSFVHDFLNGMPNWERAGWIVGLLLLAAVVIYFALEACDLVRTWDAFSADGHVADTWRTPDQEQREQDVQAALHVEQRERRRLHALVIPFSNHDRQARR